MFFFQTDPYRVMRSYNGAVLLLLLTWFGSLNLPVIAVEQLPKINKNAKDVSSLRTTKIPLSTQFQTVFSLPPTYSLKPPPPPTKVPTSQQTTLVSTKDVLTLGTKGYQPIVNNDISQAVDDSTISYDEFQNILTRLVLH